MARITIYEDTCTECRKTFRYQFEGKEHTHCGECTVKENVLSIRRASKPIVEIGSPVKRGRSRDSWLADNKTVQKSGSSNGNKRTVREPRTGVCAVCEVTFQYTSPGRPRKHCDNCRTNVQSNEPKVRQSTCKLCKHDFTYTGRGRLRVVCDRERCQEFAKPQNSRKDKEHVTAEQRIDHLMMMLASRGNAMWQQKER